MCTLLSKCSLGKTYKEEKTQDQKELSEDMVPGKVWGSIWKSEEESIFGSPRIGEESPGKGST